MPDDGSGSRQGPGSSRRYLVGQDDGGRWLAVEARGAGGGFFTTRDAAMRFARGETGRLPGAVDLVDRLAAEGVRVV